MKTRLLCGVVALVFAAAGLSASAQFPKIKKPKKEEPAAQPAESTETKPSSGSSATSSDTLKKVTWGDNGISFEVPDNWEQSSLDKDTASFFLPNSPDSVGVSMVISRLGSDFPADKSLQAYRDRAAQDKSEGKLAKWEDLNIGNAKGVLMVEAAQGDDNGRFSWLGYQNRGGVNMITVIFGCKGSAMSTHEATFRKVLGTFKIE
jgi:hypothetical protein